MTLRFNAAALALVMAWTALPHLARADSAPTAEELAACRAPDQVCRETVEGKEVLGLCTMIKSGTLICATGGEQTQKAEAIVARQSDRKFWQLATGIPAAIAALGLLVGSIVIIRRRQRRAKERWESAEQGDDPKDRAAP